MPVASRLRRRGYGNFPIGFAWRGPRQKAYDRLVQGVLGGGRVLPAEVLFRAVDRYGPASRRPHQGNLPRLSLRHGTDGRPCQRLGAFPLFSRTAGEKDPESHLRLKIAREPPRSP